MCSKKCFLTEAMHKSADMTSVMLLLQAVSFTAALISQDWLMDSCSHSSYQHLNVAQNRPFWRGKSGPASTLLMLTHYSIIAAAAAAAAAAAVSLSAVR